MLILQTKTGYIAQLPGSGSGTTPAPLPVSIPLRPENLLLTRQAVAQQLSYIRNN